MLSIRENRITIILDLVALGLAVVAILTAWNWPQEGGLFPKTIAFVVCLLSIVELVRELRISRRKTEITQRASAPMHEDDLSPELAFKGGIVLFSWIGGFVLVSWLIGIPATLPLFCCFYVLVQNHRKWPTALIFGLSIWIFIFILFRIVLPTAWPEPLIMRLLS